jgi:hypothetical protein
MHYQKPVFEKCIADSWTILLIFCFAKPMLNTSNIQANTQKDSDILVNQWINPRLA